MVRKKKAILLAEQEASARRRQANPAQASLFRRFLTSVSAPRDPDGVSIQNLTSEVGPSPVWSTIRTSSHVISPAVRPTSCLPGD